jgi:hypothetical protein
MSGTGCTDVIPNQLPNAAIKVIAKKVDKCPEWHEAAGSEAWLFVDEISIY